MANLRYVGSSPWTRVITDENGKFEKMETVKPGETFSLDGDDAKRFLLGPRHLRLFVEEGGPEDRQGNNYEASRWESVTGNATPYPELDMGSTVVGRRTITRTEDDNPEGFELADPNEGPASDNEDALLQQKALQAGRNAYEEEKNKAAKARAQGKSSRSPARDDQPSPRPTSQGGASA